MMCNPLLTSLFVIGLIGAVILAFVTRFKVFFWLLKGVLGLSSKAVGFILSSGFFGLILAIIVIGGVVWFIAQNPDSFRDALACIGIKP